MTDAQAMLIQQEGTGPQRDGRFFPYPDTAAPPRMTIGYGHNLEAKGIPEAVANMLFSDDLADAIEDVRYCFSCYDQLSRPRQLVLISMAFNLGRDKLNQFVRFIGAVHLGHWDAAADEIMNSKAAAQAPVRYKTLAAMMRNDTSEWV